MTMKSLDVSGGESVYCFNEAQLKNAYEMVMKDTQSSKRLQPVLDHLEKNFSRNEQAALAFVVIDRLVNKNI